MLALYHELLFRPIYNLTIALYDVLWSDLGIAILALTVMVRLLLWPLTAKTLHSQKAMQDLQPKLKAVQKQFKDDKERQAKETMELYKREKVSPFASCLPLLLQLPLFIALYQALTAGLDSENLNMLYSFVGNPGEVSTIGFGFLDLASRSIPLAVLAAGVQYVQARMMTTQRAVVKTEDSKDEDTMAIMNKQMLYFMPALTLFIGISLPAGLTLYWLLTNVMMVIQQYFYFKNAKGGETEVEVLPAK